MATKKKKNEPANTDGEATAPGEITITVSGPPAVGKTFLVRELLIPYLTGSGYAIEFKADGDIAGEQHKARTPSTKPQLIIVETNK